MGMDSNMNAGIIIKGKCQNVLCGDRGEPYCLNGISNKVHFSHVL